MVRLFALILYINRVWLRFDGLLAALVLYINRVTAVCWFVCLH